MRSIRTLSLRSLFGGLVIAAVISATAAPSSAAPVAVDAGVVAGNSCSSLGIKSVTIPGAVGCVSDLGVSDPDFGPAFQVHAVDVKGDGHSARTDVLVQFRVVLPGGASTWVSTPISVVDSSGKGTSRIGRVLPFERGADVNAYRTQTRACTYEAGSKTYVACGVYVPGPIKPLR